MEYLLPQFIGLAGKKGHGKDTLGEYLVTKYGYRRFAFADALKEMVRIAFSFSNDQLYGDKKEEIDPFWKTSPREVLQFIGTELFRNNIEKLLPEMGSSFWQQIVRRKINDILLLNPKQKIVITDVRFPDECQFIKELGGGEIIWIERPLFDNIDGHSSENQKLVVDQTVINDGTINNLFEHFEKLYGR